MSIPNWLAYILLWIVFVAVAYGVYRVAIYPDDQYCASHPYSTSYRCKQYDRSQVQP